MIKYDFVPWSELRDANISPEEISDWGAARAYYDFTGGLNGFLDNYVGQYSGYSEPEALGEFYKETGWGYDVPADLLPYIDWTRVGYDSYRNGSMFAVHTGMCRWYVFFNG